MRVIDRVLLSVINRKGGYVTACYNTVLRNRLFRIHALVFIPELVLSLSIQDHPLAYICVCVATGCVILCLNLVKEVRAAKHTLS